MGNRRTFLVPLGAAVAAALSALAPNASALPVARAEIGRPREEEDSSDLLLLVNSEKPDPMLLAHRSHRSHSSHRSHVSGHGGGGGYSGADYQPSAPAPAPAPRPAAPAPTYVATPTTAQPARTAPVLPQGARFDAGVVAAAVPPATPQPSPAANQVVAPEPPKPASKGCAIAPEADPRQTSVPGAAIAFGALAAAFLRRRR